MPRPGMGWGHAFSRSRLHERLSVSACMSQGLGLLSLVQRASVCALGVLLRTSRVNLNHQEKLREGAYTVRAPQLSLSCLLYAASDTAMPCRMTGPDSPCVGTR